MAAGDHAWSHHANHEALAHYGKALEVAGHLGEAIDSETVEGLHIRRAQVQGWLGRVDEAMADYERALELARDRDAAACQTLCLNRIGALLAGPRGFRESIKYAQQALEIARRADDGLGIIDSLNCLGNFQANSGAMAEAVTAHEEALALARELGDKVRIADSLDGLRLARFDSPAEEAALLQEVIYIRRRLGDKKRLLDPLTQLANALSMFQGQYERAEQLLDEALTISQRIGERTTRPWILGSLAQVLWRRGRLGEAHARAHEALDLAREIGHEEWTAHSHFMLGQVLWALYRHDQAKEHVVKGRELAVRSGLFFLQFASQFMDGLTSLQAGDAATAITSLKPMVAQIQDSDATGWRGMATSWLAVAYAEQGKIDQAREVLRDILADPALPSARETHVTASYAHGRTLMAAGDIEGGEAVLEGALALAQQMGNAFLQIEIHRALAQLYRSQNQVDDATEQLWWILQIGEGLADSIEDPAMRDAYLAARPFAEARQRPIRFTPDANVTTDET